MKIPGEQQVMLRVTVAEVNRNAVGDLTGVYFIGVDNQTTTTTNEDIEFAEHEKAYSVEFPSVGEFLDDPLGERRLERCGDRSGFVVPRTDRRGHHHRGGGQGYARFPRKNGINDDLW